MTHSERSMQIWQILICAAHKKHTLTYAEVAELVGFINGAHILAHYLRSIMKYCQNKQLPPITCLVVTKEKQEPVVDYLDLPKNQEAVYALNWFALEPPQFADFDLK